MDNTQLETKREPVAETVPLETTPLQNVQVPKNHKLWLVLFPIVAIIVLGIITGIVLHAKTVNKSSLTSTQSSKSQAVDLSGITPASASFKIDNNSKVVINGEIQATQGMVLQPTSQPTAPLPGQIYVDSTSNVLRFYNGTKFVTVASQDDLTKLQAALAALSASSGTATSTANTVNVTSLQGSTGDITLSGTTGLTVTTSGTTITIALPQDLSATASPTFAGLTLSGGPLSVANGGTGQSSFTTNGVLFGNGTSALGVVSASAGTQCLTSNGGNTAIVFATCPGSNGVTTIGTLDTIGQGPSANGATIGANTLYLQSASASNAGLVNTTTQTFAGNKTFNGNVILTNGSNLTVNGLQSASGQNLTVTAGTGTITLHAGGIDFLLPTSGGLSQQICTTGISCVAGGGQAVLLAPNDGATPTAHATVQTNNSAFPSIYINNTGGANILELQSGGVDSFVVNNNGALTLGQGSVLNGTGTIAFQDGAGTGHTVSLQATTGTGTNTILQVPEETGKLCTSDNNVAPNDPCYAKFASASSSSAYIQFAPATAQVDHTCDNVTNCSTSTIFVAKNASTGNILDLKGCPHSDATPCASNELQDVLVLQGNGQMYFRSLTASTTAFQIQNATGTPVVNINTASTVNLITDPDFERTNIPNDVGNWVGFGCNSGCPFGSSATAPTLTQDNNPDDAQSPTHALELTGGNTGTYNNIGIYYPIALANNTTYTIQFSVLNKKTTNPKVSAGYYRNSTPNSQGSGNLAGCKNSIQADTNYSNPPYTCTFTTTTSAAGVFVKVNTGNMDLVVDDFALALGNSAAQHSGAVDFTSASIFSSSNDANGLQIQSSATGSTVFNVNTATGSTTVQAAVNQAGTFQVMNASGTNVLSVDTGDSSSLFGWATNDSSHKIPVSIASAASTSVAVTPDVTYDYIIGGSTGGGTNLNTIYYAQLNGSANENWFSLDGGTPSKQLPVALNNLGAVSYQNFIYALGGQDQSNAYYNQVYYTKVDSNGQLTYPDPVGHPGVYWIPTNGMTVPRADFQPIVLNGYVYAMGGLTTGDTRIATVEFAQIHADGSLGAWQTHTLSHPTDQPLPASRAFYGITAANNVIYISGGSIASGQTNTILRSPVNNDGSIQGWVTDNSAMVDTRSKPTAGIDVTNGNLYVFGGSGTNPVGEKPSLNSYEFAAINGDGSLGSFSTVYMYNTVGAGAVKIGLSGQNMVLYNHQFYFAPANSNLISQVTHVVSVPNANQGSSVNIGGTLNVTSGATLNGDLIVGGLLGSQTALDVNGSSPSLGTSGGSILQVDTQNNNVTINGINAPDFNTWLTTTPLSPGVEGNGAAVNNGFIYSISGSTSGVGTSVVKYARLNVDGTISATPGWTSTTQPLPDYKIDNATISANGYIYVIGGYDTGGVSGKIYVGIPNSNGDITAWRTLSTTLNTPVGSPGVTTYNGYLYVMGGATAGTGSAPSTPTANIQYAKLNPDGTLGAFSVYSSPSTSALPAAKMGGRGVAANGYIYFTGGADNSGNATGTVYFTTINGNGTLNSWQATTAPLLDNRAYHTSIIANGYLYVIAGTNGGFDASDTKTLQFGQIKNGDITSWNNGIATLNPTSNHATAFANGYLYVIGGDPSSNGVQYASSSRVTVGGSLDLISLGNQSLNDAGGSGELTAGNTTIVGTLNVNNDALFSRSVSINGGLSVHGQIVLQNSANSTNAFAIQNANGIQVAGVDTTNGALDLGQYDATNPVNGALTFNNSTNTNTLTLQSGATSTPNLTFTLPVNSGSANQCLKTNGGTPAVLSFVDCVGGGGGGSSAVTSFNTLTNDIVLQGTTNEISLNTVGNTITLLTPQRIDSLATPTFGGLTINGSGSFTTSVLTPTLDSISGALNIGTTNASQINLNQNVSIASGKNFTQAGAGTLSSGTGQVTLNGNTLVAPGASQSAFVVQNAGGGNVLQVDTTATANLVSNSGFETNTAGWSAFSNAGSAISRITSTAYMGYASLQVATTSSGGGAYYPVGLTNGQQYTLAFRARAITGTPFSVSAGWYTGSDPVGGTALGCGLSATLNTAGWTAFSCTFTASSGTNGIFFQESVAGSNTFALDEVHLVTGASDTLFNSGLISLNGTIVSPTKFRNSSDSTTALRVQNASGTDVFTIDTLNTQTILGKTGTLDGKLQFASAGGGSITLQPASTASTFTLTLPAVNTNATICTSTGNCNGVGSTLQTAYTGSTGGSTSEIILDTTRNALDVQDRSTSNGGTIGANLFNVRATAANDTTAGALLFGVGNTGAVTLQNSVDSTTALQVKNLAGTSIFTADTTNSNLLLYGTVKDSGTGVGLQVATTSNSSILNVYTKGNLLTNSGFESGSSNWAFGGTAAVESLFAYEGSNGVGLTSFSSSGTVTQNFIFAPRTTYTLSYETAVGGGAGVTSTYTDSLGSHACSSSAGPLWTAANCTFTTTIGGSGNISFSLTSGIAAPVYIDAVQLEVGSTPSTYTNGNTGGGITVNGTTTTAGITNSSAYTQTGSSFNLQASSAASAYLTASNGTLTVDTNLVATNPTNPVQNSPTAGANTGGTLSGAAATTYYYKITAVTAGGETLGSNEQSFNGASFTPLSAPAAPTLSNANGSFNMSGTYKYLYTYITSNGQTTAGTASASTGSLTNKTVTVTFPALPTGATSRRVYRTTTGPGATYYFIPSGSGSCGTTQNTTNSGTTTCTDGTSDANLTAANINPPGSNTATTNLNNLNVNWTAYTGATGYKVYRSTTSASEQLCTTLGNVVTYSDSGSACAGTTVPTTTTDVQLGIGTATPTANLNVRGSSIFEPLNDSTSAFQIQNAAGTTIFNVDTVNSKVGTPDGGINTSSAFTLATGTTSNSLGIATGQLTLQSGNATGTAPSGTVLLQSGSSAAAASGNITIATGTASTTSGNITIATGTASTTIGTVVVKSGTISNTIPRGSLYVNGQAQPVAVGSNNASGITGIVAQGKYVYAIENQQLAIFDVSTPTITTIPQPGTANTDASGSPIWLQVQGSYAYVLNAASNTLQIFDVSHVSSPTLLSTTNIGGNISSAAHSFAVQGRYAYVLNTSTNKLQIYDLANPASPVLDSTIATASSPIINVVVSGIYAFVSENGSGLIQGFNVSNPLSPSSVGSTATLGTTSDMTVQGNNVYATVTILGSPIEEVGTIAGGIFSLSGSMSSGGSAGRLLARGNYLYSSNGNVWDTTNTVASPALVTTIPSSGAMDIQGRYLYEAAGGSATFAVYDLGGTYTQQLEAQTAEISVLSVDNGANITGNTGIQGALNVGGSVQAASDLGVAGNTFLQGKLSVAGGVLGGLTIGNLSSPSSPTVACITTASACNTSTNWTYMITAVSATGGETPALSGGSIGASDGSTLSSTTYNQITWPAVSGAVSYNVYRTIASGTPSTTGKIGSTSSLTFNDTGLAGSGSIPTIDTSGNFSVAGQSLFKPGTDSSTVFQIQNAAASTTLFSVDTTGNGTVSIQAAASGHINIGTVNSLAVVIGKSAGTGTLTVNGATTFNGTITVATGNTIKFAGSGNAANALTKTFICTVTCNAGDVVVIDTTNAGQVTEAGTANNAQIVGIVVTGASAGNPAEIALVGVVQATCDSSAVAIGDTLVTSATSGDCMTNNSPTAGTIVGRAMSLKAGGSPGSVWVLMR